MKPTAKLCDLCRTLFNVDVSDSVLEAEIKVPYERNEVFPACPLLAASAADGCGVCQFLLQHVRAIWATESAAPLKIGPASFLPECEGFQPPNGEENGLHLLQIDVKLLRPPMSGSGRSQLQSNRLLLELYAVEGSEPAKQMRIRRRAPSLDRTSDECIARLQGWITDCVGTHVGCRLSQPSCLPTRVLNVGREGAEPRLVETNGEDERYAALSHCWGAPDVASRMLKLKSGNMLEMLLAIPMHSMSRNFQDAVTVTRCLGLRFLWIDALCIIQDSKEDWESEGGRMDQVYKNAYVTIAATSSGGGDEGFLRYALADARVSIPYRVESEAVGAGEIELQATGETPGRHLFPDLERSGWNRRAWTMQERYLARRVLHFCKFQIYWECGSMKTSETGERLTRRPVRGSDLWGDATFGRLVDAEQNLDEFNAGANATKWSSERLQVTEAESASVKLSVLPIGRVNQDEDSFDTILHPSMDLLMLYKIYQRWYRLVGEYSPRKLTYACDKLPALSGLAREMATLTTKYCDDQYFAGLWKGDLVQGLLWRYSGPTGEFSKPSSYRAPSWSWASGDGMVTWSPHMDLAYFWKWERTKAPVLRLLHAEIEVSEENPYGRVGRASLEMFGRVQQVTLTETHERLNGNGFPSQFPYDLLTLEGKIGIGCLDHPLQGGDVDLEHVWCLQIRHQIAGASKWEIHWSGLLLKRLEEGKDKFYRMGIYMLDEEWLDFFHQKEEQICVLV